MIIPRLAPGIPLGIDATSHLSKILFMYRSHMELGYIPNWNPDWYGGTPFLLFYPPLGYFLVLFFSLIIHNPILSYKIIDAFFYMIMPFTVYYLARKFDFEPRESEFAALIFALSPVIVGNYLFYDRFPNIVALPLVCVLIACLHQTLNKKFSTKLVIISSLLLTSIILIHHLSALYVALIIFILIITYSWTSGDLIKRLAITSTVLLLSILVSSFWSIPFLLYAPEQLTNNPFFNRTIEFPYIRLSYFLDDLLTREIGIAHFSIALVSLGLTYGKFRGFKKLRTRRNVAFIFLLLLGMGIFEIGEVLESNLLIFSGQGFVLISFLFILSRLIIDSRRQILRSEKFFFLIWFILFLWLGLGYFAIPLTRVPILSTLWRSLDVHRFWIFLIIPLSILSGKILDQLARAFRKRRIYKALLVIILSIMLAGAFIKASYSLIQPTNDQLPYNVSNDIIPQELVDYFESEEHYGRILAIKCPLWIYLLPSFTEKTLIDGWYPQEKLLKPILEINDYRINDLETSENRTDIWKDLIEEHELLGINWIMIGGNNQTLINELVHSSDFKKAFVIEYEEWNISIFSTDSITEMVEIRPEGIAKEVEFQRSAPDDISIRITDLESDGVLIVKEAYYPTWISKSNDTPLDIHETDEGFIEIFCQRGISQIELIQKPSDNTYLYVSFFSFITLIAILIIPFKAGYGNKTT